jgi:23S rRNA-/tRNA-specific pseudouridylate synthase
VPIDPRRILFCDDALLAVNKLPGELAVRGKGKMGKLPLFDFLKKEYPGIHPLQRLDFATSGVMVFARNRDVLASVLNTKFDQWRKVYLALVHGKIPKRVDTISLPLPAREGGSPIPARTRYRVVQQWPDCAEVEIEMETGHHHQIRRHFSMIGHPLILDLEYGRGKWNQRFATILRCRHFLLHAAAVTFPHPVTGKLLTINAPLPPAFARGIEALGEGR